MSRIAVLCRIRPPPNLNPPYSGGSVAKESALKVVSSSSAETDGIGRGAALGNSSSASRSSSSNSIPSERSNPTALPNIISVPSVEYSTKLDMVFDEAASQEQVFSQVVPPLMSDLFGGYNCTLFVYGQTGSGKTHTIQGNDADKGIVSRLSQLLFERIDSDQRKSDKQSIIEVKLSMLEIYQEKLKDLLSPGTSSTLKIRESQETGIWVEGLFEQVVTSSQQFETNVASSLSRRAVGSHNMNQESSRSHLCYIINLTQRPAASSSLGSSNGNNSNNSSSNRTLFSKMYLVDLAGSEMVRKTDASGARLNEAKFINKSLSALGNVIYALSSMPGAGSAVSSSINNNSSNNSNNNNSNNNPVNTSNSYGSKENNGIINKKGFHVPYRDSKLTRILQDSLGGNAKTVLILTVSASTEHIAETLATLRFGDRAKMVSTKPKVNEELDESSLRNALRQAKKRIDMLSSTVLELEKQLSSQAMAGANLILGAGGGGCHDPSQPCPTCGAVNLTLTKSFASLSSFVNNNNKIDNNIIDNNRSNPGTSRGPSPSTICNDIVDKCAVCGLGDSDTLRLKEEIGMKLGDYVICDGNCGNRFHETCVGMSQNQNDDSEVRGEWFCLQCTDFAPSTINVSSSSSPNLEALMRSNGGGATGGGGCVANGMSSSESELSSDKAMVVKLTTEYHTMRKERNRVLSQWRLERQMQTALEARRKELDLGREQEMVRLQQEVDKLTKDNSLMLIKISQSKSMEMLHNSSNKKLPGLSSNNTIDTALKLTSSDFDRPLLLSSPRSGPMTSFRSSPPPPAPQLTVGENLLKDYNQDILSKLSRHLELSPGSLGASNLSSSSSLNPNPNSIPKTWKSKPKKLRLEAESPSSISLPSSLNSISANNLSGRHDESLLELNMPNFTCTSPINTQRSIGSGLGSISGGGGSSAVVHRSLSGNFSDFNHNGGGNNNNNHNTGLSHSLSMANISSENNEDDAVSASSSNPFSLRLRELIKTVKAETGDFQDIRNRYQNRDAERQQLHSSRRERVKLSGLELSKT